MKNTTRSINVAFHRTFGKILFFFLLTITGVQVASAQANPEFPAATGTGPTPLSAGASLTNAQQGDKFLYTDVALNVNGTTDNADVVLTVVEKVDMTINNVDTTLGVNNRFEPSTTTTATQGYVEWEMLFVRSGTATPTFDGVPILLDSYVLEAIDVDGTEFFEALVPDSYTLEGGIIPQSGGCPQGSGSNNNALGCQTALLVSNQGEYTRFQSGTDFSAGIHAARTEYVVTLNYTNISRVVFRNGRAQSGGLRQNSTGFLGEVTFVNPVTIQVNTPPTVNNQSTSTPLNTPTNSINLLTGATDAENNIDTATVYLIDPNDPNNIGQAGLPLVIPGEGTYVVDTSGNVVFTPVNGYTGTSTINFRVEDTKGASSNIGTFTVNVFAPCAITAISSANLSACNNNGTPTNINDDTFTADITVTFSDPPATGNLDLTGDGTASVAVGGLDSATSHTFTSVTMSADGTDIDVTATFSDDLPCTFNDTNVGTAPFECSDDTCPDVIPSGEPNTPITTVDNWGIVNENDEGTSNLSTKTFNSVTISGETFTNLLVPDFVTYQYANPSAGNQQMIENGVNGANITDPNFDIELIAANTSRNLNHYFRNDGNIVSTDYVNYSFNTNIHSAANRYVIITERGGNNTMEVQAIDASGNTIGTAQSINRLDGADGVTTYIGTGFNNNNGQEIYATVYPLTAFVSRNVPINGVRLTQSGADTASSAGDGGDGKIFVVYDPFYLTPPPTIDLTTSAVQPTCPTNQGSITVVANDNGGGTLEYSVNGTAGPWQTASVFNNLTPGTYTVAVRYQSAPTCINISSEDIILVADNCGADVSITKTLNDTSPYQTGDTVTYTMVVSNAGPDTANNVVVTDTPTNLTITNVTGGGCTTFPCTIASIAPGAGNDVTITVTATIDAAGAFTNVTSVSADETDPDPTNNDDDGSDGNNNGTATAVADVSITKTLNDTSPYQTGDTVTYTMVVSNAGPDTANNVVVTDTPTNLTITNVTGGGCTTFPCTIASIAPGAGNDVTITVTATIDAAGAFTNVTSVSADETDPDPTNNDDDGSDGNNNGTATAVADVSITKTLNDTSPYQTGDTVTYTMVVSNAGPDTANNVVVTDTPTNLTITNVTGGGCTTFPCTIASIAPGAGNDVTITVTATIDAAGAFTNVTSVSADETDPDPTNNDDDGSDGNNNGTATGVADLVTVKTLTSGDPNPAEGDTVTFTITVTNNGPETANNVSLDDTIPAGLTATTNNGNVSQGTYIAPTWTIGTLLNGASATLTIEGTVDIGQDGNAITNVTTAAEGDENDPTTAGDDLEETVNVIGCIDTDGDGDCDSTDPDPNDPCVFTPGSIPNTSNPIWQAADCDGDGVTNGDEIAQGTDPTDPCDFILASQTLPPSGAWNDLDCDGDGVTNGDEVADGTDPTDPCDFIFTSQTVTPSNEWNTLDCDGDGVPNGIEVGDGTDPTDPCDFIYTSQTLPPSGAWNDLDCDGDGVTNGDEVIDGTDPTDPCDYDPTSQTLPVTSTWNDLDCDGDGVPNGQEVLDGTDPNDPCNYDPSSQSLPTSPAWDNLDCDGDGVTNGDEINDGTNPLDICDFILSSQTLPPSAQWFEIDCDGDGVTNGDEVIDGTDPTDICDFDYTSQTTVPTIAWELADCDCDGVGDGIPNGDETGDENNNGIPDFLECNNGDVNSDDNLDIFDIMTPNGDGLNDVFVIRGIERYPDNTVEIFNRWGVQVYKTKGYGQGDNYFRGISNGRVTISETDQLPVGTYYYVLTYVNDAGDTKRLAGPLYINRK